MFKCLLLHPHRQCRSLDGIRCNSIFRGAFDQTKSVSDPGTTNILYLNASHGPSSLVAEGSRVFLENLNRTKRVEEIQLWNSELVQYRLEHAISKLNILRGDGSEADREKFAPVLAAAEKLNSVDLVLVATPMWNFSVPFVLKQYIDTVVQPGINFNDTDNPALTERSGRLLVVFSSAGAEYSPQGPVKDFLNPFLQQIFGLMGFTQFYPVFIQGTAARSKSESLRWTQTEAVKCAHSINSILQSKHL